MEAKPTQYKGKLFRSKTEAMFALILDLSKAEYPIPSRWVYEDERFTTPNLYVPDFTNYYSEEPFLSDFISLIEVKPSFPTTAYLRYLEKQFTWIKSNDCFHFINWFSLYIFNPYEKIFMSILMDENNTFDVDNMIKPEWFKDGWFDIVLKYRFDLNI